MAHQVVYKPQQQRYKGCAVPIMLDCSAVAAIPDFILIDMTVKLMFPKLPYGCNTHAQSGIKQTCVQK
jgi:hypothetical protein